MKVYNSMNLPLLRVIVLMMIEFLDLELIKLLKVMRLCCLNKKLKIELI